MTSAVTSDERGKFEIQDVPAGTYTVLYESGLSDFDDALAEWGGKTLHFSDRAWMADFLNADLDQEWVAFRLPEGISPSPHENWLSSYCGQTLLIGDSPFIIAHDMVLARDQHLLNCLIVDIVPGRTSQVEIYVVYFDE